jgi:four helix bundle protein
MNKHFGHEQLDVYRASVEFSKYAHRLVKGFKGTLRHTRDELLRSAESIPRNIAEGNGKWGQKERRRYFKIANGSATESAASLDILIAIEGISQEQAEEGKALLLRIVSMLTRMIQPRRVPTGQVDYDDEYDYDND